MLKLMKYEFIHSYRTFLISFVVFLVGCAMLPFTIDGFLGNVPFLVGLFGAGFAFLLIGICIALFISIFINYDRSMFKKPGYLTLTLPVTTTQIIISKVLTTVIWLIVAFFVLMGGFLLMAFIVSLRENTFSFANIFDLFGMFSKGFMEYLMREPLNFLGDILFVLGNLFLVVGSIYFSLTSVHTKWCRKHQWIFGIIIYFIINLLIGWISGLIFGESMNSLSISVGQPVLFSLTHGLYYIVVGTLLTIGTIYFIDHHLEIE